MKSNQTDSQKGSEANRTGSNHRDRVKELLHSYDYSVETNYKPEGCHDFAGCQIIIPIFAYAKSNPNGIAFFPFYQGVSGTAYQKIPAIWMKIAHHYPCPAVVVAEGHGLTWSFAEAYVQWLKSQVDYKQLLGVFDYKELSRWLKQKNKQAS